MSETIARPMASVMDRLSAETKERLSIAGRLPGASAEWSAEAARRRPSVAVSDPVFERGNRDRQGRSPSFARHCRTRQSTFTTTTRPIAR